MLVYPGPMLAGYGQSKWAWSSRMGWNGPIYGVIHATAAPGATAQSIFNYFMGNAGDCSHFVIGKQGEVYQCADPNTAASANCCPSDPSPFVGYFNGVNANYGTWSIEIVKNTIDNSEDVTEAQYQSVVNVCKWLCVVCHTKAQWCTDVSGGITSHSYLDPVHRPGNHDPGPFDWDRFWVDLVAGGGTDVFSDALCITIWESHFRESGLPIPPRDLGLFVAWRNSWRSGHFKGCCMSHEYPVSLPNGHSGVAQNFAGGTCVWDNVLGTATWL
jgi:hypothetical protein